MPQPHPPTAFVIDSLPSPIGTMLVVIDDHGRLRALDWEEHEARLHQSLHRQYGRDRISLLLGRAADPIRQALDAYFAGDLAALDRIPVQTAGTPFQRQVWAALRGIRAGRTLSYGALARSIGRPAAVRAVGHANGANPISVVIPCHRLIGANASLTGYGGGLHRKRWLLTHEGVDLAPNAG